jgi:hypothetical protein
MKDFEARAYLDDVVITGEEDETSWWTSTR